MRSDFPLEGPPGRHVLLVAPHPDDEVIGCGGTLHRLARGGAHAIVVVAARGDGGIGGGAAVDQREEECRRSCEILLGPGSTPPVFLRLPSPDLRDDPAAAAAALAARVGAQAFDLVLVPAPLERHPTHTATLLAALLTPLAGAAGEAGGRGAWDALPACADVAEIDITDARQAKTRALAAHQSQTGARPLGAGIAGRDMPQAVFSRLTGDEPRKAVERLLALDGLAPLDAGARSSADAARAAVQAWITARAAAWAAERWS